jgi:integrase
MTTWSAAEVAAFFARDDVKAHRSRAAWWVAVNTGLRRGELLGLRWRDLDLDRGTLTVAQVCRAVHHVVQIVPGTKTGKGRTISLDDVTIAELRAHKAAQARELLALGIAQGDESLVFARQDGKALDPDRFGDQWTRFLARRADIRKIRFHDLRHTHATILLRAGVPLIVVSRRLGHRSIAITADTYGHIDSEMQADAAQLGAALIRDAGLVTNL